MDIGAALREARQRRNRTLRQVSAATKISVEILEKIERNKFDSLPGGLFRRGYLRAFALDVGVDPEAVVEAYRAEYEPPPEVPEKATRSSMSPDQLRLLASAALPDANVRFGAEQLGIDLFVDVRKDSAG